MKRISLSARLRYAFDNTLSHGPLALIVWLGLATIFIIALAVLVDLAAGGVSPKQGLGPIEVFWSFVFQTLVPNPPGSFDVPSQFLITMLFLTLASLLMVSILIGLLNAIIQGRVAALRRGRSPVIESGHTVILGWSEQIFTIISQLMIANANHRKACIVVLSEMDKVDMEDEIRQKVRPLGRTRVVCRTGDPIEIEDLEIASLQTAKSIIILSGKGERPDINTIKTMLAIVNGPNRRPEAQQIVAQIRNPNNIAIARLIGRTEVELVPVGDVIARIIAQTCRQSGLSAVYTDLLDYEGSEIYFQTEPSLAGTTFGEALFAYEDSTVIGLYPEGGVPKLNPPMDTRLGARDQLIVLAEDDATTHLSGTREFAISPDAIRPYEPVILAPQRTALLGWNWRGATIVGEIYRHSPPGSTVYVVADDPEGVAHRACARIREQYPSLTFDVGDTSDRQLLDQLHLETYNHVVLLCYSDGHESQVADARTMVTLLHLRDISAQCNHAFSIVSEILDIRNRNLVDVDDDDDFIVSDQLISFMLAQISENRTLNAVFTDIFDADGSEIYLKPAASYVAPEVPVNFYTVCAAARQRSEVAIGYRLSDLGTNTSCNHGVVINPRKSTPITFSQTDRLILLAES